MKWIKEIMYGLVSLIHIFNPPCIVLGGGVFAQTYVVEKLEKMLCTNIMPSFTNVVLRQAELGNTAGSFRCSETCLYIRLNSKMGWKNGK